MIKGTKRETENKKYVGMTQLTVKAVNPDKTELAKLLGTEEGDDINYLSKDQEGNDKVRLSFWFYDNKVSKYIPYSIFLTNKVRKSNSGEKTQYINNTCGDSWADDPNNLPDWFTNFQDTAKNNIGKKVVREAVMGEEDLLDLLKNWMGRMIWRDKDCHVMLDNDKLFSGDFSELKSLIASNYDTPVTALLGVRTDENDNTKQYQQVWKNFLPKDFINYIEAGKFPTEISQKTWAKFENEVEGKYGFNCYFELTPVKDYDSAKDVATSVTAKADITPTKSKY